jgi:hypothetical protein
MAKRRLSGALNDDMQVLGRTSHWRCHESGRGSLTRAASLHYELKLNLMDITAQEPRRNDVYKEPFRRRRMTEFDVILRAV